MVSSSYMSEPHGELSVSQIHALAKHQLQQGDDVISQPS